MKLPVVAVCLFVVSFFLPAYDNMSGYECAKFCSLGIWGESIPTILYYFPFTLSNVLMLMLPVLLMTVFKQKRIPLAVVVVQIILIAHVISWRVMNRWGGEHGEIQLGYYVWLLSMALMFWCVLAKRKAAVPFSAQHTTRRTQNSPMENLP